SPMGTSATRIARTVLDINQDAADIPDFRWAGGGGLMSRKINQRMRAKMANPPTASTHSCTALGSLYQLSGSPSISNTANMSPYFQVGPQPGKLPKSPRLEAYARWRIRPVSIL